MPKKKHIILARNKKISESGLELDGKRMKFARGSALWVEDEGKARALQQKYGKEVAVTLDQQYTWHANNDSGNGTKMNNIHRYTFSGVDINRRGGNERVKVKTADGYTFMSKTVALEEGYEIIKEKKPKETRKAAHTSGGNKCP